MAELADALGSGSSELKLVGVRVPPSALSLCAVQRFGSIAETVNASDGLARPGPVCSFFIYYFKDFVIYCAAKILMAVGRSNSSNTY